VMVGEKDAKRQGCAERVFSVFTWSRAKMWRLSAEVPISW
jgi:hypothetical protein